ncbi:general odorant-binding protein 69 [Anopheles merus]|uniref:general odorant-binding protein 69 n=1 Tax=Anopheles merus TaxID=30066 RepID=UPI001BE4C994|nr:general odorant-binding protein 69 [Anopheles merus]
MDRLLLVLLGSASLLLTVYGIKHHILTKSWSEAQSDCLQYLRIESPGRYLSHRYRDNQALKQLIFCIMLNLRIYDPTQNVLRLEAMGQFFNPDKTDTLYVNRTNACLLRVKVAPLVDSSEDSLPYSGVMETLYEVFRCFYHCYGNINTNAPKLPPTVLELEQIQQECARIIGVSERLLDGGLQLRSHPRYSELSRCIMLRSGESVDFLTHRSNFSRRFKLNKTWKMMHFK